MSGSDVSVCISWRPNAFIFLIVSNSLRDRARTLVFNCQAVKFSFFKAPTSMAYFRRGMHGRPKRLLFRRFIRLGFLRIASDLLLILRDTLLLFVDKILVGEVHSQREIPGIV